ncbi:MAG: stage 0 sporulation family protein [Clostridia bacterium]
MVTVVGIKFKLGGKIYYFNPGEMELSIGENVIVETARGIEYGTVAMERKEIDDGDIVSPLKEVIRIATEEDRAHLEMNKAKEKEAFRICEEKIARHKLDMKLVEAEYTFDNNKILFYFTADGRVDFRELVKDLASVFRTRIELRQIGIRDEAKMLGGLGICGRSLCCSAYLDDFHPVSIKMAKEQGLSLNPTKISGVCGRLMCCLKYEQNCYEEMAKITPNVGAQVRTPDGVGIVNSVSLLKGLVKVQLDKGDEKELDEYSVSDISIIRNGKAQRNKNDGDEELDYKEIKKLEGK